MSSLQPLLEAPDIDYLIVLRQADPRSDPISMLFYALPAAGIQTRVCSCRRCITQRLSDYISIYEQLHPPVLLPAGGSVVSRNRTVFAVAMRFNTRRRYAVGREVIPDRIGAAL
jgi:hypothetical protein